MRFITKTVTALVLSALFTKANAIESFVVEDIQVEGLQRVELGTLFTALPIRVGETLDDARVPSIIRSVYKTGNFEYVKLEKEGNTLKVLVVERPVISSIVLKGNKVLKTEQLLDGMKSAGIIKGEVLNSFVLEKIEQEISNQYFSNGHYDLKVEKRLVEQSRNRIQLHIDITEGGKARIAEINFVGNQIFSDTELLDQMELTTGGLFSAFTSDNSYSSSKLDKDLETVTSYYKDRGYIKFQILSVQVSLSDNQEEVYITVNVQEDDIFTVRDIKFAGDLKFDETFYRDLVLLKNGDKYSAAVLTFAEEQMKHLLGLYGYAFPEIRSLPEIVDETNEVDITVYVNPGNRYYVDSVTFSGNATTDENVLRRETRISEGQALSSTLIERSKLRLQRLEFIEEVNVETPKKEGSQDKLNVNFEVKERAAAQISGSIGYNDFYGFQLQGDLTHNNFLGAGTKAGVRVNTSKAVKSFSVNYSDPYFFEDDIGLSGSLSYRETDFAKLGIIGQSLDTISLGGTFYYPIGEFSSVSFGLNLQDSTLDAAGSGSSSQRIIDFFESLGKDPFVDSKVDFSIISATLGWQLNTLNQSLYPTAGYSHGVSVEVATSLGDVEYYKANYDYKHYFPITNNGWIFLVRANMGYGNGYGDTNRLPYFSNFYGGGSRSLRGFETNTIGPKDINRVRQQVSVPPTVPGQFPGIPPVVLPAENDQLIVNRFSVGGNATYNASLELIFPTPFAADSKTVRTSLFVDAGNVWDTEFDLKEFEGFEISPQSLIQEIPDFSDAGAYRASAGISVQWFSPMGPIVLSVSKPLKEQLFDETETFTFSFGRTF